ncbi:MAG: pentapeptide repeat-containing protein, partial [Methylococcales bacterium]|nr:pentapeptide repeat-containing protein [Methylococcales bacterium]
QSRINRSGTGLVPTKSSSQTGCYSDNPTLLACEYHTPAQLDTYRTAVLHPKLISLACSDAAIAAGIVSRGYNEATSNDPNFGLAAALVNAIGAASPCAGLASLPEQTLQRLRKAAQQQEKDVTPK